MRIQINTTEKRNELIWAISKQDYEIHEISKIFNLDRATIWRIMKKMPVDWKTPWVKKSE